MERYGEGAGPELAGKLVKYTSLGCYPVFYTCMYDCDLCADCANRDEAEGRALKAQDVNWEDLELYCDGCSCRIESAYGESADE